MNKKNIQLQIKKLNVILGKIDSNENKNFLLLCKKSLNAVKKGKKIIFFGNGGSAADSQHLATELTVKFKKRRVAIAAIALTNDTSAITAIGNDFEFIKIFSRQIEALGNSGDICIALTTSGNSQNLIEAIKVAKKKRLITFCFSGNNGGRIKKYVKYPIIIPSKDTSLIQVVEVFLGQIFCGFIENNI